MSFKNIYLSALVIGISLGLSACSVELRDAEEEKETVVEYDNLVIDEKMILTENTVIKVGTLSIGQKGSIVTRDHQLSLEVAKLTAVPGSAIRNFDDGDTAPKNTTGIKGGDIQLRVLEAVGTLKIKLQGQQGGEGLPRIAVGFPGGSGGQAGSLVAEFADSTLLNLLIENSGGAGGVGGLGLPDIYETPNEMGMTRIPVPGANGSRGMSGQPGKICIKKNAATALECR